MPMELRGARFPLTEDDVAAFERSLPAPLPADYREFLLASLGFGLCGASFAVGVAYTSIWFPKEQQGTVHVFGAAPNALLFRLGQLARGFGAIQLYEHEQFGGAGQFASYAPSLRLSQTAPG